MTILTSSESASVDHEELCGAVNLTEFSLHNHARADREGPVRIIMPPQQWAYAAVWPIHDTDQVGHSGLSMVVRVEATIHEGRIGVAVAREDLQEFICVEEERGPHSERQTVEIRIASPISGMHLVIRNTAADGTVSTASLHGIRTYVMHHRAPGADSPGHGSAQRGAAIIAAAPPITGIPDALPQGGGGTEVFDTPAVRHFNEARLHHLARMMLPLEGKSVLDVGCGVGHLSRFFVERGCRVTCVDARTENISRLESLYPGTEAYVADIEVDSLAHIGYFDVVLCYDMLYHTENPIAALRNIAACCRDILLLETVVTDYPLPMVQLVDEPNSTDNQAAFGFGCRPTSAFVAMALTHMGFSFVYTSKEQPGFPDFHFEWKNDAAWQRDGHLLRRVFVASRAALDNPHLTLLREAPKEAPTEALYRALAVNSSPEIWLDVGAHLGEKTFSAAAQNPNIRVYAFEPNLPVALRLMGRLPNYTMLALAVSQHDGSAPFYVNRFDAASSLLTFVPDGLEQWVGGEELHVDYAVTVPTIRLDTFLKQAGISKVAYLKIDAQGGDLDVVRSLGQRLPDVERISLEVQTTPIPLYREASCKEDVIQFLAAAGFELVSCEKQSHDQEENLTFVRVQ